MLKKLSLLILIILTMFLGACSNTRIQSGSYEKTEVIRQAITTPKNDVILLGDNFDYMFTGEEAKRLLTVVDFLKMKGLTYRNLYQIEKSLTVSKTGTVRLIISTNFKFFKRFKGDDNFEKEQKIFIDEFKRKLKEKNIDFKVEEDDKYWTFDIDKVINVVGKVTKLENHDKILQETSNQLIELEIDSKVYYEKEVQKTPFIETLGDGAREVYETVALVLTAPIWVPFVAVYTLIAIPALIIAEAKYKY